jgi:hypothetical protein
MFHIRQWRLDCKTVARYHQALISTSKILDIPQKKHEWVVCGRYFSSWLWSLLDRVTLAHDGCALCRFAVLQAVEWRMTRMAPFVELMQSGGRNGR